MAALVLNPTTAALVGIVDDYDSLEDVRRYYRAGSFRMVLNRHRDSAQYIAKGRVLAPDSDHPETVYLIEQIESVLDDQGRPTEALLITGRSLGGMLEERRGLPPAGLSHDEQTAVPAETAMKHYVTANADTGAAAARQFPNFTVDADQGRGATVSAAVRYQTVATVLEELGQRAGLGWEIYLDGSVWTFEVIEGQDLSATVILAQSFDSLANMSHLSSDMGRLNYAYVGGQGEGAAREIVERYVGGAAPTGFDRRETFVDARDIEAGATALLQARGDAALAEASVPDRYLADVYTFGTFRYREEWDLGDIVRLARSSWGIDTDVRVVEVHTSRAGNTATPSVSVQLDAPWPNLKDRLLASIGGGNASGLAGRYGGAIDSINTATVSDAVATHAALPDAHHARAHNHSNALDGTTLAPASVAASGAISTANAQITATVGTGKAILGGAHGSLELNTDNVSGLTPFIDFHYSNVGTDYTARVIADADDTLKATFRTGGQVVLGRAGGLSGAGLTGLTAGHVLRASSTTAFSFGALQAGDLPAHPHNAEALTPATINGLAVGGNQSSGIYSDSANLAVRAFSGAGDRGFYAQSNAGASVTLYAGLAGTYANKVGINHAGPVATLDVVASARPSVSISEVGSSNRTYLFKSVTGSRWDLTANLSYDGTNWQRGDTGAVAARYSFNGIQWLWAYDAAGANPAASPGVATLNVDGTIGTGFTHGAGTHTNRTARLYVEPIAFRSLPGLVAATYTTLSGGGGWPDSVNGWSIPDPGAGTYTGIGGAVVPVPSDWASGTVRVRIAFFENAGAGIVKMACSLKAISVGSVESPLGAADVGSTEGIGLSGNLQEHTLAAALTITAQTEFIRITLYRSGVASGVDGTGVDDTSTNPIVILSTELVYTADQ